MAKPHTFLRPPWEYDVAYGRVPEVTQNFLTGVRLNQSSSSGNITIWDASEAEGDSGNIVYLTTDEDIWVASTDAADSGGTIDLSDPANPVFTGVVLLVRGLDSNFEEKQEFIAPNGQTPVQLAQQYQFIQSAVNVGTVVNAGDIYLSATAAHTLGVPDDVTKIQSKILTGVGITRNGFLIVPKNKVAVTVGIRGSTDANSKPAEIETWIRQRGSVFVNTVSYSVSPGFSQFIFPQPVAAIEFLGINSVLIGEGAIIEFKSNAVANGTNVFFGSDFIISDIKEFELN